MSDRYSSDIFSMREPTSNEHEQLYSIGGTPSGKKNRLRGDSSNVFPIGCMGTKAPPIEEVLLECRIKDDSEEVNKSLSPRIPMEAGDNDILAELYQKRAALSKSDELLAESVEDIDIGSMSSIDHLSTKSQPTGKKLIEDKIKNYECKAKTSSSKTNNPKVNTSKINSPNCSKVSNYPKANSSKANNPKANTPGINSSEITMEAGDSKMAAGLPSTRSFLQPKRNPLTGEGVETMDMPKFMHRKRYDKNRFRY